MEFIVFMYLKICVWLVTLETPHRGQGGLFYPPLNLIFKKEGCGESGTELFLFNDFVQKNDKLWRYEQKADFGDIHILLFIF